MEGSESEKIFDSFNLNPQLFINEVINSVDDLVDEAFDFFQQYESSLSLSICVYNCSFVYILGITSNRERYFLKIFLCREAAVNLKTEGTDRSDDLKKVSMIQYFRYSAIKTSNSPFAQIKSSFYCRCVE